MGRISFWSMLIMFTYWAKHPYRTIKINKETLLVASKNGV
jgi:hypothetical protein